MTDPTSIRFDGLEITYDSRILEPRPWTVMQSRWAAELSADLGAGPILELCCGAGHIGLAAARRSGRDLVGVDVDPVACELARRNADANGLGERCTVLPRDLTRWRPMADGLDAAPIVLADPPYVPSRDVARHPDDPLLAIDGGDDGLRLVAPVLRVAAEALSPGGAVLVQLASSAQADALPPVAPPSVVEVDRRVHERGVVVYLALEGRSPP